MSKTRRERRHLNRNHKRRVDKIVKELLSLKRCPVCHQMFKPQDADKHLHPEVKGDA